MKTLILRQSMLTVLLATAVLALGPAAGQTSAPDGSRPSVTPNAANGASLRTESGASPSTQGQAAVVEGQGAALEDRRETEAAVGVIGSVHDFSRFTQRPTDACSACHVPHIQGVQVEKGPGGRALLDLYRIEGQRQVFIPGRYMPGPTSVICLSCHNGTVADSTISTAHGLLFNERLGFDEPDEFAFRDHPIGIPYPADPKEYRPATFVQKQGVVLPEGRIECISCHDPHNEKGVDDLLVMSNRRSALCLTCHKK